MKWEGWFSPAAHTPGSVKNPPLAFALWSHKENLPYLSLHPLLHSHDWDWVYDQGKKVQTDLSSGWFWPYCQTPAQTGGYCAYFIDKQITSSSYNPPELLAGKLLSRETLLNESPNDTEQTKPIGFYKHDLDNLLLSVAVMGNVHFLELFFSILIQGFLSFAMGLEYCNYDKFFAVSKFKILRHLSLGSTFTGWVSQYLAFDAVYIVPLRFWHRLQVTDITQVHTNVSHKSHWWQNRHLYEVFLICLTYLFLKVFINQLYFNLPLQSA